MKLLAGLERELRGLDERGLRRRRRIAETPCAPHMAVDGKDGANGTDDRKMLAFCSNDYLGLANHPRVVEALREGALRYGVGSGASALVSGHSRAHEALEDRLADFLSPHIVAPRVLAFCSGYMANLAVLSALGAQKDGHTTAIFSETLNHASLIDGARLSRTGVQVYPHRDVEALAAMLAASDAHTKIVATDSVFSMDGDIAPLRQLLAVCEEHEAWLIVDDAHGFGVLGANGRGALEHFDLRSPNLVYMGTLSKAAGVSGAFVAAHETVIEWLLQRARTYIFTTGAPPALAHALLASLEIIAGEEGRARREQLQALIRQLQAGLRLRRWDHLHSDTGIQPIVIGDNNDAVRASAALYAQGFWIPAIRPPTVPAGTARLRVTLSAAHEAKDVAQLIEALNGLEARQEPEQA
jgi:8-amino-7-oxononanoate synthase